MINNDIPIVDIILNIKQFVINNFNLFSPLLMKRLSSEIFLFFKEFDSVPSNNKLNIGHSSVL